MGNNFFKRDDRDIHFVLKEHLQIGRLLGYEKYNAFTMQDFDMILDLARDIARDEIAPTFQDTDRDDAARFENGRAYAPRCFHRLWGLFKESGLFALAQGPEYGGQGLPLVVAEAATEFFMSANFSFGTYSGMGPGQGALIENFGSAEQKDLFCRKLYDGTWGGAMDLTEPGAGSDAHMVAAKAVKDGDYYRVTGSKVFITSGDHDLTENIIHLLLARIEGAPPGARGVSLFAVPRLWVDEDGSIGGPNDVHCVGIEHKMGLHGSATCQMSFGDNGTCRGHLVGEPGMGLAYMFQMVNVARMAVGLECAAFGANIYANVLEYARERVQGGRYGEKTDRRVRIVEHPEIRRLLMTIKALTEGIRALVYRGYLHEDISRAAPDEEERARARDSLDLFTPIIKGYSSERIWELCAMGIQVLGGYGYTSEYPIEQYARDCKIFSIWDGTTYIQSIDLVGRKVRGGQGRGFKAWIEDMRGFAAGQAKDGMFAREAQLLAGAVDDILAMVSAYGAAAGENGLIVPLTSTRFLDCCGEAAVAHLLLEQAVIASARCGAVPSESADFGFYQGKIATARFFALNFLPNIRARRSVVDMNDLTAAQVPEEYL
jgi:alkylation response protein AidB-like acyl-CoA dehydrogenase